MKRYKYTVLLLIAGITIAFVLQQKLQRPAHEQIKVIAHRGGAAYAPENTLAALEAAIVSGADIAEFDLRATKDGVIVAIHDESLARTTGVDRLVNTVNSSEICSLNAGSWFSCDFCGEHIPTLEELLDAAHGKIRLMLELKTTCSDQEFLARVVEVIQSREMEHECILASADLDPLRQGKYLAPTLENVYICGSFATGLWVPPYLDSYSICSSNLTYQDVLAAHQAGVNIYVWTVNERSEIERALSIGVDGLVTDDPALALKSVDRFKSGSSIR